MSVILWHIHPILADLLRGMLSKDPDERYTLAQIRTHDWVTGNGTSPLREVSGYEIEVSEADLAVALQKISSQTRVIIKKKLQDRHKANPDDEKVLKDVK